MQTRHDPALNDGELVLRRVRLHIAAAVVLVMGVGALSWADPRTGGALATAWAGLKLIEDVRSYRSLRRIIVAARAAALRSRNRTEDAR